MSNMPLLTSKVWNYLTDVWIIELKVSFGREFIGCDDLFEEKKQFINFI